MCSRWLCLYGSPTLIFQHEGVHPGMFRHFPHPLGLAASHFAGFFIIFFFIATFFIFFFIATFFTSTLATD